MGASVKRPPTSPDSPQFEDRTAPLPRNGSPRTAAPLGAVVRVVGASGPAATFRLGSGSCIVGSGPAADLVLNEATVSRSHLELGLVAEGVAVRDLGSRNGTFYQGQRIEKMVLAFGGQLQVGASTLVIEADSQGLQQIPAFEANSYRGLVASSLVMRRLFAILARLEGSLATVLVEGESGVGKELIARALHDGSTVARGPFVAVNCGAIPRDLVASELFGHRRGAFSGAHEARRGAFESANGGTLFLDELGELPLEVQPVLLRALELGEVRAVGDDHAKRVKVRVVAATNRGLEDEVRGGRFRQDLFYRLAVVRLTLPPLRERSEDIEPLAQRFAEALGLLPLEPGVIASLRSRSWPGNVRELQNAIQVYAALGVLPTTTQPQLTNVERALADALDPTAPYASQKDAVIERFTRAYLSALMAHTHGNQSAASRIAGLNRSYLGRLLVKHGIPKPQADGTWDIDDEPNP
jgi:DNA-binding NtrC family response regulator